jgi:hypothetical protein
MTDYLYDRSGRAVGFHHGLYVYSMSGKAVGSSMGLTSTSCLAHTLASCTGT